MTRLAAALAALDRIHADDPQTRVVDGARVPAELAYARWMTEALLRLEPAPSEALQLAVRAQHLARWTLPRAAYPEGAAGYHAWRTEQGRRHAARAAQVLEEAGYDDATVERVARLVTKKDRRHDHEAQALEDAACLVFLEHELAAFAEGRGESQLVRILERTWPKMSERARARALGLPLDPALRALVARAVGA